MEIVDFHTHIMSPWASERRVELSRSDPCFGMLYSNPKAQLATAEDLVRSMDEAEVQASVVLNVGWSSHELCVRTNDYLLEAACRWTHRIIPFCMVQPVSGDPALRELERCADAGARGIGELRPDAQGYSLSDAELLAPLVEASVARRLILLVHASEPVGHVYPGKGAITPNQPYAFAKAFPDITLVCAHWGGGLPFYALMPEVASTLANVMYDTAATQYLYRRDVFDVVARIVGNEHILFGSDFPLLAQRRALEHVRSASLEAAAESAILGSNAARVLSAGGRRTDE
jgi:uncharacterized protein